MWQHHLSENCLHHLKTELSCKCSWWLVLQGQGLLTYTLGQRQTAGRTPLVLVHSWRRVNVQAADCAAVWLAASHAYNKMYPSIKLLLSLTICVRRLGFTHPLTLCYCRICMRRRGKEGLDLDWQAGTARRDWYNICWAGDRGKMKTEFTVGIVSARCRHTASALHLSQWPSANTCI